MRRATVIAWLKHERYGPQRGWKRGRARKHTDPAVPERICRIKRRRLAQCYLVGSEYVQMDYARHYPGEPLPSLWHIDQVVRQAGLQSHKPCKRVRGGSTYLLYPRGLVQQLGTLQESADFIGKKYLAGRTQPVTIFASCYYQPFKLFQITRTEAERATYAIEALLRQWHSYPVPQVMRLDNAGAFIGSGSAQRRLGVFVVFLLNLGVTPLFAAPRSPWQNGHIEGHNRVFGEKLWKRHRFTTVEELDQENARFNQESAELFQFKYRQLARRFHRRLLCSSVCRRGLSEDGSRLRTRRDKKICFVRFVEVQESQPKAGISIMNELVPLPEAYARQFVFASWDLQCQRLTVTSEYQGTVSLVTTIPFKIND